MARNDQAQANHDELFPGHVSTLAVTDPDLFDYFDNFGFDEVLRYGALDTRTRLMVQLAALVACQGRSEYPVMLGAALTVGVTPHPADQLHLQRYLSANCFGDHYTCTGIDLPTRQLLTFAMLISMVGCEPQAKGHVAASLNVGNTRQTLLRVATQLLLFIGYPRTLTAVRLIDEVIPPPTHP